MTKPIDPELELVLADAPKALAEFAEFVEAMDRFHWMMLYAHGIPPHHLQRRPGEESEA